MPRFFKEIIIFPYNFGKKKGSKVGEERRCYFQSYRFFLTSSADHFDMKFKKLGVIDLLRPLHRHAQKDTRTSLKSQFLLCWTSLRKSRPSSDFVPGNTKALSDPSILVQCGPTVQSPFLTHWLGIILRKIFLWRGKCIFKGRGDFRILTIFHYKTIDKRSCSPFLEMEKWSVSLFQPQNRIW